MTADIWRSGWSALVGVFSTYTVCTKLWHAARLVMAVMAAITAGTAFAAPAPPRLTVDKVFGKVAGWSIGYSESMGGCLAAATYEDDTTVWLGFGGVRNTAYLALVNSKWRSIEPGTSYTLKMRAHGQGDWKGQFMGFKRGDDMGLFAAGLKDKFLFDVSQAGGLKVGFEGRQIADLSLVGSEEAIQAVLGCQKDYALSRAGNDGPPKAAVDAKSEKSSQGTGFYVSEKGHVVTNNHVIDGCSRITVTRVGAPAIKADLIARDGVNDLAVLRTDYPQDVVPALAVRARIGESVYVYGFPLSGLLASTGNFTVGNVTATAGLADDTRMLQISAPIQPGNSGGPVVDQNGNVVGVIVSKLNVLNVAKLTDDFSQNVNFAIKTTILLNFLDANGIAASVETKSGSPTDAATIAEKTKAFVVRVNCQ